MADDTSGWQLLVAFPDESPSFVHGFEAGRIWQRMKVNDEAEIWATTHPENREVIRRMADAEGWSVEVTPTDVEGWDRTLLTKRSAPRERPNPHGLRVVTTKGAEHA